MPIIGPTAITENVHNTYKHMFNFKWSFRLVIKFTAFYNILGAINIEFTILSGNKTAFFEGNKPSTWPSHNFIV